MKENPKSAMRELRKKIKALKTRITYQRIRLYDQIHPEKHQAALAEMETLKQSLAALVAAQPPKTPAYPIYTVVVIEPVGRNPVFHECPIHGLTTWHHRSHTHSTFMCGTCRAEAQTKNERRRAAKERRRVPISVFTPDKAAPAGLPCPVCGADHWILYGVSTGRPVYRCRPCTHRRASDSVEQTRWKAFWKSDHPLADYRRQCFPASHWDEIARRKRLAHARAAQQRARREGLRPEDFRVVEAKEAKAARTGLDLSVQNPANNPAQNPVRTGRDLSESTEGQVLAGYIEMARGIQASPYLQLSAEALKARQCPGWAIAKVLKAVGV